MTTLVTLDPTVLAFDWDAAALQQRLQAIVPGTTVEVRAEAGSTNTELLERQRRATPTGEAPAPVWLVAERQTAGRGRLGRSWWSEPGSTLTCSLGLALEPADWSGLSLAVGLAVAEALDPTRSDDRESGSSARIGLKWPNDLWLRGDDRKLAGILIEAQALRSSAAGARGSLARWAVVGIGINLRPPRGEGGEFRTGYACLDELEPGITAPAVLQRIAPAVLAALQRFEREGLAPLLAAYALRDVLAGRRASAGDLVGRVTGIAPGGELCLRDDAGQTHRIASGEVSVRPC
ncbi:biotin--[acetyl-CoA-carboxylase] ligase [Sphaerotilus microaerophilus]|uniref:biotin--[biotin carboxyl-carrier protein] ligase n=1 Tax=Sphaerotilus microaerophilus TaxID=2914710 RepID=A0ABM7YHC4_9BURK|nr:biotin--[acetyl-CoA-carboxylase] ligase [Sphaerotilus sp. FB-5]BDI03561.1 bifunctional ligase/repressor BirA [Sphaerotilus sp. FB-5]